MKRLSYNNLFVFFLAVLIFSLFAACSSKAMAKELNNEVSEISTDNNIVKNNGKVNDTSTYVPILCNPQVITSLTYNGEEQQLVKEWSKDGFYIKYALCADKEWPEVFTDDIPKAKDAGTYYVWYRIYDNNTNESRITCTVTVVIKKADPYIIAPSKSIIYYNGQSQCLINPCSTNFGTLVYGFGTATKEPEIYTKDIPQATDPGLYYVWYKVIDGNNYNEAKGIIKVYIEKERIDGLTAKKCWWINRNGKGMV